MIGMVDMMRIGVIREVSRTKRRIPDRVAVFGQVLVTPVLVTRFPKGPCPWKIPSQGV